MLAPRVISAFRNLWRATLVALSLTIAAFALSSGQVAASKLIWQVGTRDGGFLAVNGAREFPATGTYSSEFEYLIDTASDPISSPECPGYLGNENVCSVSPGRPCTDTTLRLVITFTTARPHRAGELQVLYGRYGSETDSLFLDSVPIGLASSLENVFVLNELWLPATEAGTHSIAIAYQHSTDGNGHYIDFVALYRESPVAVETTTWGAVKALYDLR